MHICIAINLLLRTAFVVLFPTDFGLLSFHFHLFPSTFNFVFNFFSDPLVGCCTLVSLYVFVVLQFFSL